MSEPIPLPLVRRRVLGLILGLLGGMLTFSSLVNGIYVGISGLLPKVPKDMFITLVEACIVGIVLLYFGARLWRRP
jgi:fluoride ion exporter CrcB/FEX